MSDAPEKIGIAPCHPFSAPDDYYVVNPLHMRGPKVTEYIRADLYEALRAENARLRAENQSYRLLLQSIIDLGGTMGSNLYADTVDRACRAALETKGTRDE